MKEVKRIVLDLLAKISSSIDTSPAWGCSPVRKQPASASRGSTGGRKTCEGGPALPARVHPGRSLADSSGLPHMQRTLRPLPRRRGHQCGAGGRRRHRGCAGATLLRIRAVRALWRPARCPGSAFQNQIVSRGDREGGEIAQGPEVFQAVLYRGSRDRNTHAFWKLLCPLGAPCVRVLNVLGFVQCDNVPVQGMEERNVSNHRFIGGNHNIGLAQVVDGAGAPRACVNNNRK